MLLLENDIGFLLGRTDRAMKHYLLQHLRPLGITVQQFLALVGLSEDDGISQDALAQRMYVDISFITRILQHLEEDGLVTRTKDERDARVNLVWLTPEGHALREKIDAMRAEALQKVLQNLDEREVQELKRLLNRIFSTVQSLVADCPRSEFSHCAVGDHDRDDGNPVEANYLS